MKKQVGIMLILLATGISVTAQNERDAFRYAEYSPTGTARYSALAGSMGAFGADFSCLSAGNPAGLGLFKRFEFTITPALSYNRITSTYNEEQHSGTKYAFVTNNLGVVFVGKTDTATGWKKVQFATGLNNLARYDGSFVVAGPNEGATSFFDYIAQLSNITNPLDSFAYYALKYGLIGGSQKNGYYSLVDADLNQQQFLTTSGYLNEYVFSLGGNYNDKLFLGATLGIPFFKYEERLTYTESRNHFYDSLIVFEDFNSKATGINLKLGIIYQPFKYMRLGAAFHTPTLYPKVRENYETSYEAWGVPVDSFYYDIWKKEDGGFDYQLRTPYHAMANVAFIYKNKGFINIDYEYVDYAVSEFQSDLNTFSIVNEQIRNYYKGTHTIRIGGECNLSPLAFRLGYAYTSNPYTKEIEKDGSRHTISAGIGIKAKYFFTDFAYIHRISKDKDVFYSHESVNPYTSSITNQFFVLTLGWKIKM